jgi:Protein of unknown function (DUF3159)
VTARSTRDRDAAGETLGELLGGRGSALDASLPPLAFMVGWLATGESIAVGAGAALAVGIVLGAVKLWRGGKITAVLISVAAVGCAALIALHTGQAADFFLLRLLSNGVSALLWAISIAVRWPLLGVVVGVLLRQRTRWRRDPDLLRAYARASWVWVLLQYILRVLVWGALWLAGEVVALGLVTVALSWPLVALTVVAGGWVLVRSLPAGHPGLRHPRVGGVRAEYVEGG